MLSSDVPKYCPQKGHTYLNKDESLSKYGLLVETRR